MHKPRRPGTRIVLRAARPASSAGPPASAAAGSAANQPFWASWGKQLNDASSNFSKGTQDWWAKSTAGSGKPFKMPKWEMPGAAALPSQPSCAQALLLTCVPRRAVKVDVDVLNPVIKSVKQASRDIYRQLPPPVQQALPFISVAFASSFVVWTIQAKRLANEVGCTVHSRGSGTWRQADFARCCSKPRAHGLQTAWTPC